VEKGAGCGSERRASVPQFHSLKQEQSAAPGALLWGVVGEKEGGRREETQAVETTHAS